MINMSTRKEALLASLNEKKSLLNQATKLASSWNTNRHQHSGNTQVSRNHVKALQMEIKSLQLELSEIDR